jgi:hypothetical protein
MPREHPTTSPVSSRTSSWPELRQGSPGAAAGWHRRRRPGPAAARPGRNASSARRTVALPPSRHVVVRASAIAGLMLGPAPLAGARCVTSLPGRVQRGRRRRRVRPEPLPSGWLPYRQECRDDGTVAGWYVSTARAGIHPWRRRPVRRASVRAARAQATVDDGRLSDPRSRTSTLSSGSSRYRRSPERRNGFDRARHSSPDRPRPRVRANAITAARRLAPDRAEDPPANGS